jgi:hypothetical protein
MQSATQKNAAIYQLDSIKGLNGTSLIAEKSSIDAVAANKDALQDNRKAADVLTEGQSLKDFERKQMLRTVGISLALITLLILALRFKWIKL